MALYEEIIADWWRSEKNLKSMILEKHVYFLNWRLSPTIMHMGMHCNEATRIKQLLATIFTYFNRQIRGALKLALKHISITCPLQGLLHMECLLSQEPILS